MRVNVYAEEMTDRVEIIAKKIDGHNFTGLRFYLELPVSYYRAPDGTPVSAAQMPGGYGPHSQLQGPFMHRPGDDDSSAVTFWGKRDMRDVLRKALDLLDAHYAPSDFLEERRLNLRSETLYVGDERRAR